MNFFDLNNIRPLENVTPGFYSAAAKRGAPDLCNVKSLAGSTYKKILSQLFLVRFETKHR
jgi:hypothetical protein